MSQSDGQLDVQELYHDLARKHRNVGTKVDAIWRKFTPKQREEAMRESTGDGEVLKHSRDRRLGELHKYIPEYNFQDMTSEPEHFLNIFKFRASTELYRQLYYGANEGPGDREVIEKTAMQWTDPQPEDYTFFMTGENYGRRFKPGPASDGKLQAMKTPGANFFVIPSVIGYLILLRQQFLFQFLNHIVEEILDLGSETKTRRLPRSVATKR
jgi:hypothetical protein